MHPHLRSMYTLSPSLHERPSPGNFLWRACGATAADANTLQASIKAHFTFLLTTLCMFPNATQWHKLIGQSLVHAKSEYPHHNDTLVTQIVIDKGSAYTSSQLLH